MVSKYTELGIEISLNYKGIHYDKIFKTKAEIDNWIKLIE